MITSLGFCSLFFVYLHCESSSGILTQTYDSNAHLHAGYSQVHRSNSRALLPEFWFLQISSFGPYLISYRDPVTSFKQDSSMIRCSFYKKRKHLGSNTRPELGLLVRSLKKIWNDAEIMEHWIKTLWIEKKDVWNISDTNRLNLVTDWIYVQEECA